MNNTIKILSSLTIFLLVRTNSQQVSLPYLRNVTLKAIVEFEPSQRVYSYFYSIKNDASNTAQLDRFEIDVSRDTMLSVALDNIGLQFKNTLLENWYRDKSAELLNGTVPLSFPSPPQYGEGALTVRRTVDLLAKVIKQGEEAEGFVMASKGLPGIRKFTAFPYYDVVKYYPSIDEVSDPDSLIDKMDRDRDSISFHGYTIGPTAPPKNFVPTVWIDTLLSYTRQSAALGWLGKERDDDCDEDEHAQDGIVKNIEQRLQKAKRELLRKDSVQARRELEKLVTKVERLWKRSENEEERKHGKDRSRWWNRDKNDRVVITSEAYALLKYNTEYLIDRLPERKKRR